VAVPQAELQKNRPPSGKKAAERHAAELEAKQRFARQLDIQEYGLQAHEFGINADTGRKATGGVKNEYGTHADPTNHPTHARGDIDYEYGIHADPTNHQTNAHREADSEYGNHADPATHPTAHREVDNKHNEATEQGYLGNMNEYGIVADPTGKTTSGHGDTVDLLWEHLHAQVGCITIFTTELAEHGDGRNSADAGTHAHTAGYSGEVR
jgi:hypothetical protein